MVIVHLLLQSSLLGSSWLRGSSSWTVRSWSRNVVLSKRLLVVAVVLDGLVLARVDWITSCVWSSSICLMVYDTWLCNFICLGVFLITWCFFQWLSLLIINLAITVTWHYWALLTMMGIFDWLLPHCAISESGISRLTIMVLLEVVNLLILGVSCSYYILFPVSHAVLHHDVAVVATGSWLNNATLLNWAKSLVGAVDWAHCSLGWDLIRWILPWLTNSKLEKLFDVLWRDLWWSSNLNHFCLWLVMASWHLLGCIWRCMLVWRGSTAGWISWALSWADAFRSSLNLIYTRRLSLWSPVSWVLSRLIRCVSSEEISAFRADLEVTWTWTSQSLICLLLRVHIVLYVLASMSSVLSVFHCLLLLVWNLLQKREIIGFSVLFLYFWWIHILWINNF